MTFPEISEQVSERTSPVYITYEIRDGVPWIVIARPEKLNCLDLEGWHAITACLHRAAAENPGPLVITGQGRAFCAGDDINSFSEYSTPEQGHEFFIGGLYRTIEAIALHPYPVVAAVNGLAYGGGCELVLVSDLAIASQDARFSLPEGRIGAWPTVQVGLAPHVSGRKSANELAYEMGEIPAEAAVRMGLVNRVVPAESLEEEVRASLEQIRRASPHSLRKTKSFLNEELRMHGLPKVRRALMTLVEETLADPDLHEGTSAFLEKRSPRFGRW